MIKHRVFLRIFFILCIFLMVGCGAVNEYTRTKVGQPASENVVEGSAGDSGSEGSVALERCSKPLGTVTMMEEERSNVSVVQLQYQFQQQGNLPSSSIPLMRMIMQQSGCLQVVDRSAGLRIIKQEKELVEQGLLAETSVGNNVQLVRADYTITPSIVLNDPNAGGMRAGAVAGSIFGPIGALVGGIAGGMKKIEAQVVLFLVDNRTGVQIASATGSASKKDLALGGGLLGLGGGGFGGAGLGGYESTDQGKIVAAAMLDAFNKIIRHIPRPKLSHEASSVVKDALVQN